MATINTYYLRSVDHHNELCIVDELDPKTVDNDEDSSVAVQNLQGCIDELKQKMQRVNIKPTASYPVSHQLKDDDPEKEEMPPQFSKEKVNERQSLPLIYSVTTNPSIDDQDGEVWKYVSIILATYYVCNVTRIRQDAYEN